MSGVAGAYARPPGRLRRNLRKGEPAIKKILVLALCLAIVFSLAACGAKDENPYSELEPAVLVCADNTGEGSAGRIFGDYFAQRVLDITEGKLTIDYRPGGALGGDLDLIGQMRSNKIQLVICQTAPIVSAVPELAVFDLPMAFAGVDGDIIDAVLNGTGEVRATMDKAYERAGLHLLGFLQNGTYRLTTANRPLSTLEDFQGLRIRTMENDNHAAFWAALGAAPTAMPWGRVYSALKDGRIDAEENAADTVYSAKLQEVQSCLARTEHVLYCNQICINAAAWDGLDPVYRNAVAQAAADAIAYVRPLMSEVDEYHTKKLIDSGMQLVEYDASFRDSILALPGVQALYDDIDASQTGGLASALLKRLGK